MKNFKLILTLLLLSLVSLSFLNPVYSETVLFHVKTSLAKDDAQICAVPNVAMASLAAGDKVILLFDASAVTSITRGWGWFNWGSKTPMDKASLPHRERKSLSEQFKIPLKEIPGNYGEYLLFIKKKGAEIYVNSTMIKLYNIKPVKVDNVAIQVDLKSMMELFKKAERIITY